MLFRSVAILGAGLIGCEFANDLTLGGYKVDVIDLAPQALGRLIPEAAATALQTKLSEAGVQWHFNTTVQTVDRSGNELIVTLSNGSNIACDFVLSAVGLNPRVNLAKASGIVTGAGIQVNRELETNLPDIYALGDRKSTRLNSSHTDISRMPSSA